MTDATRLFHITVQTNKAVEALTTANQMFQAEVYDLREQVDELKSKIDKLERKNRTAQTAIDGATAHMDAVREELSEQLDHERKLRAQSEKDVEDLFRQLRTLTANLTASPIQFTSATPAAPRAPRQYNPTTGRMRRNVFRPPRRMQPYEDNEDY